MLAFSINQLYDRRYRLEVLGREVVVLDPEIEVHLECESKVEQGDGVEGQPPVEQTGVSVEGLLCGESLGRSNAGDHALDRRVVRRRGSARFLAHPHTSFTVNPPASDFTIHASTRKPELVDARISRFAPKPRRSEHNKAARESREPEPRHGSITNEMAFYLEQRPTARARVLPANSRISASASGRTLVASLVFRAVPGERNVFRTRGEMGDLLGRQGGRLLKLGIAVGEGTGPEVRAAFEAALGAFANACDTEVRTIVCGHRFDTFGGIAADELSASEAAASSDRDAARYGDFLREVAASGAPAVFRTAINAQPLYAVREQFGGVKVDAIPNDGGALLLVRDEAQGFYAGSNDTPDDGDRLVRTCVFSRAVTERVLDAAWAEALRHFGGPERIDLVALAYKFHLLDRRFAIWVADWARTRDVELSLWQPDTVNRQLRRGTFRGNVLLVGSNEWGDIMHAELVSRAGLGSQDEHCSRNIYTAPELGGLVEHQTVHGSADDIAGRSLVNPTAALRAAATILEEHAGVAGIRADLEAGLARTRARGVATPDAGGRDSTEDVTRVAIEEALAIRQNPIVATGSTRSGEALVIIDLQNDFCASGGRFAELGLIVPSRTKAVADVVGDLLSAARREKVPVLFVRTHTDPDVLPPNVVARHRREGRSGYLRRGEWGAEPFGPIAADGEKVLIKALYDPFLDTEIESTLEALGVQRLVLAGVFADVCVDATARTAFQKGLDVSVVADATLGLEGPTADALAFMKRYYGAGVATAAEISAGWAGARESHTSAVPSAHPEDGRFEPHVRDAR